MTRRGGVIPQAAAQLFAAPQIEAHARDDGCVLLRSRQQLGSHAPTVAHLLRAGAAAHPERVLVTRRQGTGQTSITWADARRAADALGQALLDRGLRHDRPLMLLSGNSIEHLLMSLAGQTVGVPVIPLSPAYSLMSRDHERIKAIAELCRPGAVFADDADRFAAALGVVTQITPARTIVGTGHHRGGDRLEDLIVVAPTDDVERAHAALGPDAVAKIMFTSGSTGVPKGVLTTHRMLCSNQQALGQVWPFLRDEPPVLVDWLPWSHTFGGSHNVNQILAYGGTLHIDDGKPSTELFGKTLDALRRTSPTVYYNVPNGYALLVAHLERDRDLAESFFARLRFMFYAAAALPHDVWDRLNAVADKVAQRRVPLTASWGTTETAPAATSAHFWPSQCGGIGVPLPGVELKLVPVGGKFEIRVRGPNVTPGYHRNPGATHDAFDEEGYYVTGDAVRLVVADDPNQGLFFDGRLAENFKLTSGTWVTVGQVRTALLSAAGGLLSDAVIAGHDREYVGALVWLNRDAARTLIPSDAEITLTGPVLRCQLAHVLSRHNASRGTASRVMRLLLLDEPPNLDAGEVTDKGYINQRAVLERRAAEVEQLYVEPLHPAVIAASS